MVSLRSLNSHVSHFCVFSWQKVSNPPYLNWNVFEDQPEGMDVELVPKTTSASETTHNLIPGDMVEVCEGELVNLQGTQSGLYNGIVYFDFFYSPCINSSQFLLLNDEQVKSSALTATR